METIKALMTRRSIRAWKPRPISDAQRKTILEAAMNAPSAERATFSILIPFLGAIAALGPLSNDLYLPSMSLVAAGLDVSGAAVQLTMSSLLIGFSFGALIYGPLSDRFGRKPTLYAGLGLYAVGALASAISPSLTVLYAARFVWGMGSAGPRVMALAVVRDRYEGETMAKIMSFIMAIFILVPVVAPALGAAVLAISSWRWVFGFWVRAIQASNIRSTER